MRAPAVEAELTAEDKADEEEAQERAPVTEAERQTTDRRAKTDEVATQERVSAVEAELTAEDKTDEEEAQERACCRRGEAADHRQNPTQERAPAVEAEQQTD